MNSFSRSQTITKPATVSKGGIVAAQHRHAAEAGAAVLEAGGDAIDAAVATSFALGVVEPWMSGPAGGGAMMVWRADEAKATCVFYGMRSPAALDPADYPFAEGGQASDLFPWKAVVEDRNVQGATAVAVPGVVDGIGIAHARWGRMPWRELLQPAIGLARQGLDVDWYAALIIAASTRALAADPDAAATFLEDAQWPPIAAWTAVSDKRIDLSRMADMLGVLAEKGHREFFDGEIGEALARDVAQKGGSLSFQDLNAYSAEFQDPLLIQSRQGQALRRARAYRRPDALRRLPAPRAGRRPRLPVGRRAGGGRSGGPRPSLHRPSGRHGGPRKPEGAGLNDALLGSRSARQHGGDDADAAVGLRLSRALALDRPAPQQRHHVVQSRTRAAELSGACQALPDERLPRPG